MERREARGAGREEQTMAGGFSRHVRSAWLRDVTQISPMWERPVSPALPACAFGSRNSRQFIRGCKD